MTGAVSKMDLIDMKARLDKARHLSSDIDALSSSLDGARKMHDRIRKKKDELELEIQKQMDKADRKREEANKLLRKTSSRVGDLEANLRELQEDPSFMTKVRTRDGTILLLS